MEIEITAMNKVAEPKPNKRHDVIVANFDAIIGPFRLHHCALVKLYNRNGEVYRGLGCWAPFISAPIGKRGIIIVDREFHQRLVTAAQEVYRALGGSEEGSASEKD